MFSAIGRWVLGAHDALGTVGFGAGVGEVVALAVDADDEHGASVALADGLVGSESGRGSAVRGAVADALSEAAMAKLVGAAEEFDGVFRAVGGESRFHGAVMLVAKREEIGPHRKEECNTPRKSEVGRRWRKVRLQIDKRQVRSKKSECGSEPS